jgi:hypothetical protein
MVEGLYRGWDELRSVPLGTQSGLRVIVLFTDGASNSVPGNFDGSAKGIRTYDFPKDPGDTFSQTHDSPHLVGLFDTQGGAQSNSFDIAVPWNSGSVPAAVPANSKSLPATSFHDNHRSPGIKTAFPLFTNTLKVNGVAQSTVRPLRDLGLITAGKYPSEVFNVNNAARNLVEIIANEARNDDGDYKIRIYTIGMGQLVPLKLGTVKESSASILTRIANDKTSPDFNAAQLEGKYYYAKTAADVGPAFQALQAQIVRLSK